MIVDYINTHQAEFWIVAGFTLLIIELLLLGLSTGVVIFAGLGCLLTGLLMLAGVLPETWLVGISGVGINTAIVTALLWKPFRKIQGDRAPTKDNSSDFVGLEFVLETRITLTQPGKTRYSGVDWRVEIDPDAGTNEIDGGQYVVVTSLDAGVFRVKLRNPPAPE